MRAFIAIALPEAVLAALAPVQAALPLGRAVEPGQLHLTLAFLGERPDAEIEEAHLALEGVRAAPFELRLRGLELGGDGPPAALWARVAEDEPLRTLRARVLSALHGAGLPLERRRFRPHVTLARFGALGAAEHGRLATYLGRWAGFPAPPFTVEAFGLWRSTLRRSGAVHEELARYPLGRG
jgi:2'-5' RNA ligase